jgi:hypothetical protein
MGVHAFAYFPPPRAKAKELCIAYIYIYIYIYKLNFCIFWFFNICMFFIEIF